VCECALCSLSAAAESGFVEKNKKAAVAHPKCWAGILLKGSSSGGATADFKYT
jgi:hypothetical protein